jgi:hypothetical protein
MESRAASVTGWVAIAVHLALGVVYAFTGLAAPRWAVALLWAIWLLLLAAAVMLQRTRPSWTPIVPIMAAVLWVVALTLGERLLGWTA